MVPGVLAVGALAACAPTQPPEFDRSQSAEDRLTTSLAEDSGIRSDSTRVVGTTGEYTLYLARPVAEGGICAVAVRFDTGEGVSTGCSDGSGLGLTLEDGTRIEVGDFRYPSDVERTRLSESVSVLG